MTSTSDSHRVLYSRVHQQEVVAELGQQALATDDLDRSLHDPWAAVAETVDTEYATVLELLPAGDEPSSDRRPVGRGA